MKKLLIIILVVTLGAGAFAYPMISWGGRLGLNYPLSAMGTQYEEDPPGTAAIMIDGLYAFDSGLTVGAEGLFDFGDFSWGIAPVVGYTYINNFYFQAQFQPLQITTTLGMPEVITNGNTTLNYRTGAQVYIGFLGYSFNLFRIHLSALSIGTGVYAHWGQHEWNNQSSSFNVPGRYTFFVSVRSTALLASPNKNN